MSVIFGEKNQRITWDKTRRLVDALIWKECLANYTWLGKSHMKGVKKLPFRSLEQIHQVLVATLKKINATYTSDDFKDDMVKHVLKYAYLNAGKNSNPTPSDILDAAAE